jgi:hypothetical protein
MIFQSADEDTDCTSLCSRPVQLVPLCRGRGWDLGGFLPHDDKDWMETAIANTV